MNSPTAAGLPPAFVLEPQEVALASALAELSEAVLITRADLAAPGPTIIAVSPGMEALTGYPAAEMLGRNPRFLQGPLTERVVVNRLREACERGEHFVGETVNYRKDGSSYILQWTVDPVRDRAGRVTHFFSLQRDITAQRGFARQWLDAEARARAAHETLGAHLRTIAEAILVLEKTKRSFRSAELGALRERLSELTQGPAEPR
jgi:PAS domain S-box-containing protein